MRPPKIACVLVTFNRIAYLKKTLKAYENQIIKPDFLIVVDNHSTDGTEMFLSQWKKQPSEFERIIIRLPENIGGSGGFYEGSKKALDLDADWIWFADDDAYPEVDTIKKLKERIELPECSKAAAVCATVIEHNKINLGHRRRYEVKWSNIREFPVPESEYTKKYFKLSLFSYVGVLIKKSVLQRAGLCDRGFFIYYDDTEHSYRVSQCGDIICYPDIRVIHDKPAEPKRARNNEKIDWHNYYSARNSYIILKRHFPKQFVIQWCLDYVKTIAHLIFRYKVGKYKLRLAALEDARNEKLGIHKIYRPGWKLEKI